MQQNKTNMKSVFFITITLFSLNLFSQKPCEISTNLNDSIGTYKTTKDYLVYEKNFNEKSSYIFASLVLMNGTPTLHLQFIEKSKDFIKAKCFDKNSKIYLQLINGKIIPLIHTNEESCGTLLRDDKGINNRVLDGYFLLKKDDYGELKKSPISFIQVRYSMDKIDYIFKKELKSELDGNIYEPEDYLINYLHCLE